jgi:hypothetical protein
MSQHPGRFICAMPDVWAAVHRRLLRARNRVGDPAIPEPPPPLVLAGWASSSDIQKEERWAQTLRWATQHGFGRLIPTIEPRNAYHGSDAPDDVVTREKAERTQTASWWRNARFSRAT